MNLSNVDFIFKNIVTGLLDKFNDEVKNVIYNRILEYQVYEFKRNYYSKSFLHRANPVRLDNFYLPIKLNHKGKNISTLSIKELSKQDNYIFIIGSAGSGKSTLIKSLFVQSIKEKFKIPIKLELRYVNNNAGIEQFILNYIIDKEKLSNTKDIAERALNSGRFAFFFDGLDEVASSLKATVIKELEDFCTNYPKNFFILTSRPNAQNISPSFFSEYYVCDLTKIEIPIFIKKQFSIENEFSKENELSDKIIETIENAKGYRSFLVNPLLLSMFILTYQNYSSLPSKKSTFYFQVFETLFHSHDSYSKLGFVREKKSGLSKEQFEEVLKIFSFKSYFEERIIFDSIYLNNLLNLIKEKKIKLIFENNKIIEDLVVGIGVLIKIGLDYSFPHRSLQEYFAASYISNINNKKNKRKIYNIIRNKNSRRYGFNNQNILNLLLELDYVFFHKYYALPIADNTLKEFKSIKIISGKTLKDFYDSVNLIGIEHLSKRIKSFRLSMLINLTNPSSVYVDEKKFNHLLSILEDYLTNVRNELSKNDLGDEELIDLII